MTSPPRGFAALPPERRKEIASLGGKSLLPHQRAFSQDRKLAASAGSKGGVSSHGGGLPKKGTPT